MSGWSIFCSLFDCVGRPVDDEIGFKKKLGFGGLVTLSKMVVVGLCVTKVSG